MDQECKVRDRRRSDTDQVLTINHDDAEWSVVSFMTPSAPYENFFFEFWSGMVARVTLKGIDGETTRSGACGLI